jgi:uncharacterized protein
MGQIMNTKKRMIFLVWVTFFSLTLAAKSQDSALATDPPADKANPAVLDAFELPSHGSQLHAIAYVASGAGPHPAVILLHGFPGMERNFDVAQAIRRAGYTVVLFTYRGAWGSQGAFSFSNGMEDAHAAVEYLRVPANAKRLRVNPDKIVIAGHSMGGWIALATAASDPNIRAVLAISAADMAAMTARIVAASDPAAALKTCIPLFSDGSMAPLAGTTPEAACKELIGHAAQWSFANYAKGLGTRPVLLITSDDGFTAFSDGLAKQLRTNGDQQVREIHLATDHAYSDKRIALTQAVLEDLASLKLQ